MCCTQPTTLPQASFYACLRKEGDVPLFCRTLRLHFVVHE